MERLGASRVILPPSLDSKRKCYFLHCPLFTGSKCSFPPYYQVSWIRREDVILHCPLFTGSKCSFPPYYQVSFVLIDVIFHCPLFIGPKCSPLHIVRYLGFGGKILFCLHCPLFTGSKCSFLLIVRNLGFEGKMLFCTFFYSQDLIFLSSLLSGILY